MWKSDGTDVLYSKWRHAATPDVVMLGELRF
jgi:hypothetical protein